MIHYYWIEIRNVLGYVVAGYAILGFLYGVVVLIIAFIKLISRNTGHSVKSAYSLWRKQ